MATMRELLDEVARLPSEERWKLVRFVLRTLEHEQSTPAQELSWHDFLRATYGSLSDSPLQRWDQGEFEEREPLE